MLMTLIALILTLCLSGVDDRLRNFVENWCLDCHQGTRAKADLDLEILLERIDRGDRPDSLWRMLTRLERGDMPPPIGISRPANRFSPSSSNCMR